MHRRVIINFRLLKRPNFTIYIILKMELNTFGKGFFLKLQKGVRIYPPTVSVAYRFPRGTVLIDRAAYRTFLTVFRDFCLKARTLP
jgi:hypothetical protein